MLCCEKVLSASAVVAKLDLITGYQVSHEIWEMRTAGGKYEGDFFLKKETFLLFPLSLGGKIREGSFLSGGYPFFFLSSSP